MAVSFISGGNWSTRRKPPTCCKSLTNSYHTKLYWSWVHLAMRRLELTTLVVIGTASTGSCKSTTIQSQPRFNIIVSRASLRIYRAQLIVLCKTCRVLLSVVVCTYTRVDNSSVGAQLGAIKPIDLRPSMTQYNRRTCLNCIYNTNRLPTFYCSVWECIGSLLTNMRLILLVQLSVKFDLFSEILGSGKNVVLIWESLE